jgi:Alpha-N-acetylglucosaminidase (NAGLU) tim-barrel domain/Alpha-N-acetylglucosaminidase (NAGLU) C-terminal domain/Alpha-N-acetylglucosaminidase (NAGLU) N-terminal domain
VRATRQGRVVASVVAAAMSTGLVVPTSTAAAAPLRDDPDTGAARAAITRLAPRLAHRFVLERSHGDGQDQFTISGRSGKIILEASSNVALVSAFSDYLERVAGGQVARGPDHIPAQAPSPAAPFTATSPYRYRYINNFTVGGYTSPNWTWQQWQAEIDQMAAHGINMALVTVGQEAVWVDTFRDFGYTDEQIRDWIVPTAHQPWQWMGNIEDTGSGLTTQLIERRAQLSRKIIDRMRDLGITPVVPGFSGLVPPGFADRNPGAHIIPQGDWHDARRPDWLDTTSDIYQRVAADYYHHQRERFGQLDAQAIDLLHEGGASGDVPLPAAAQGIQRALRAADPNYLWVIQAWQQNPRKELVDALDTDHLLVLDLTHGQWNQTDAFDGAPWAWGELGNYGGRLGLFGHLDQIATGLPTALHDPGRGKLTGIAFADEGLEQDPVVEQLWSRMTWQDGPVDLDTWIGEFVRARYGQDDPHVLAAWRILVHAAYTVTDSRRADSVLNAEPDLNATGAAQRDPKRLPYDPKRIEDALAELLHADASLRRLDTYQHDLVDVTRQVIVNRGRAVLPTVDQAYTVKDRNGFDHTSAQFLHLMDLEQNVLSTREEFLFGPWVEEARSWGTTPAEQATLVEDAKRLLTIWAHTKSGFDNLKEYANRDWAGLISGYYRPRWKLYFAGLNTALATGGDPKPIDWFAYGQHFVDDTATRYATTPSGDPYATSCAAATELIGNVCETRR